MNRDAFTLGYMSKEAGTFKTLSSFAKATKPAAKNISSLSDAYKMMLKLRKQMGNMPTGVLKPKASPLKIAKPIKMFGYDPAKYNLSALLRELLKGRM